MSEKPMTRKNIKVDEDLFARLAEHKRDHETWNSYLQRIMIAAGGPAADTDADREVESDERDE